MSVSFQRALVEWFLNFQVLRVIIHHTVIVVGCCIEMCSLTSLSKLVYLWKVWLCVTHLALYIPSSPWSSWNIDVKRIDIWRFTLVSTSARARSVRRRQVLRLVR